MIYILYKARFSVMFAKAFRKKGELAYLPKDDRGVWKRSLCDMVKEYWVKGHYGFRRRKIVFSFCKSHFEVIKRTEPGDKNVPIVALCV
ncbi:MAG: hypothetical protein J6X47_10205, partial [Clostridia bacterium]|nr:hypothetical protein [Clostridia bacterium]